MASPVAQRWESIDDSLAEDSGANASPLAFRQLLRRFIDVCNAIAYAHNRGVIHRDLKPANVLLGPYGETLVVDWGLAKIVGRDDLTAAPTTDRTLRPASQSESSETLVGTAIGTPAYMSPEQAGGLRSLIGPASDIYSLGATLYTLLAGKPPQDDPDLDQVLRAHPARRDRAATPGQPAHSVRARGYRSQGDGPESR